MKILHDLATAVAACLLAIGAALGYLFLLVVEVLWASAPLLIAFAVAFGFMRWSGLL